MSDNIYVPPSGPPNGPLPPQQVFQLMGQDAIFTMCRDFYERLEHSSIRHMFPADMPVASEKLAAFLVGVLGGPMLYLERHGPPRMRQRHLPFAIDEAAKDVWLGCFLATLEEATPKYGFPPEHLPAFKAWVERFAGWMVNRAPKA